LKPQRLRDDEFDAGRPLDLRAQAIAHGEETRQELASQEREKVSRIGSIAFCLWINERIDCDRLVIKRHKRH
jgi:hypothetical protein